MLANQLEAHYILSPSNKQNESLREYLTHFNAVVLETPGVESNLKVHAFVQGLRGGLFFESLVKNLPSKFEELLARVDKFIQLQEAKNSKRVKNVSIKKEKRMEEKKKPLSEGKIPYDRVDRFSRTYTPLTKQPAELLEVVLRKPEVQFPYGHDKPPRQPQSEKFYKFHNEYGYFTNDCRNLKMEIEKLIQEGELLIYVRKESNIFKRRK